MSRALVISTGLVMAALPLLGRQLLTRTERHPATTELHSGGRPTAEKLPAVVIEEPEIDAGEIPIEQTAKFAFTLRNTGEGPLEITARPHCGCTIVKHDKVIPAGGSGTIKTELKTDKLRGRFKKLVEVQTNDPDQAQLYLSMTGRAIPPVEILPGSNPSFTLQMQGTTDCDLRLQPRAADHVEVTRARCSVPYAQTALEPSNDEGRPREYRLRVTVQPEAPLGRSKFFVTLSTTADVQRELLITVNCEKGIIVSPTSLRLRAKRSETGAPARSTVFLRKRGGNFNIQNAVSSDPSLEVRAEMVKAGSLYRLWVSSRVDTEDERSDATITVETDDLQQPRLEVPVTRVPARDRTKAGK